MYCTANWLNRLVVEEARVLRRWGSKTQTFGLLT